ncbi:hypothetical protein Dsin_007654 [Dipteronia sinensis]|uniref:DUF569 domain-containing protein n=1 Tax=Dipteronia sinensis TaxID=43782 RepID=A0AAE0B104_9ROSI|nr:hypothetical protein Dsin_007654 [Dipteronia sinensis]
MEFFNKAKAVRLRSHLGKYLAAAEDEETVRLTRDGSSRKARWTVEFVEGDTHIIRLKSHYNKYLTASSEEQSLLAGMTGKKVIQTEEIKKESCTEWEPRTEGIYYVKLRTRSGKFLRANGGSPPWRNTVTHDVPRRTATQDWVLWQVDVVDILRLDNSLSNAVSFSSFSSSTTYPEEFSDSDSGSPVVSLGSPHAFLRESGMDLFQKAKVVRFRSHHDKYLLAEDDEETVCQDRNGIVKNAKWTVEFVDNSNVLRFKSCFGKYLTASNMPLFLGMSGKKVLQTIPRRLDSSLEWEPIREGMQVRLRTRYGLFLRANGGVPPWRNSVTHDIPQRTSTQDWILWDVDILEFQKLPPAPAPAPEPQVLPEKAQSFDRIPSESGPLSISLRSPTAPVSCCLYIFINLIDQVCCNLRSEFQFNVCAGI